MKHALATKHLSMTTSLEKKQLTEIQKQMRLDMLMEHARTQQMLADLEKINKNPLLKARREHEMRVMKFELGYTSRLRKWFCDFVTS